MMGAFAIGALSRFLTTLTRDISDGETVHNAFFDRNFRVEEEP